MYSFVDLEIDFVLMNFVNFANLCFDRPSAGLLRHQLVDLRGHQLTVSSSGISGPQPRPGSVQLRHSLQGRATAVARVGRGCGQRMAGGEAEPAVQGHSHIQQVTWMT